MKAPDPYLLLGVPRTATQDQIKTAWRRIARTCHPDTVVDKKAGEATFILAKNAYDLLSDPIRRAKYDQQRITTTSTPPTPPRSRVLYTVSLQLKSDWLYATPSRWKRVIQGLALHYKVKIVTLRLDRVGLLGYRYTYHISANGYNKQNLQTFFHDLQEAGTRSSVLRAYTRTLRDHGHLPISNLASNPYLAWSLIYTTLGFFIAFTYLPTHVPLNWLALAISTYMMSRYLFVDKRIW